MSNKIVRPLQPPPPGPPTRVELAFMYRDIIRKDIFNNGLRDHDRVLDEQARLFHEQFKLAKHLQTIVDVAERDLDQLIVSETLLTKVPQSELDNRARLMALSSREKEDSTMDLARSEKVDDDFTVNFQRRYVRGAAVGAPPSAVRWARSEKLHGAVFELGERPELSAARATRWGGCFSTIERLESGIKQLSASIMTSDAEGDETDAVRPVCVTEKDKKDILSDGLAHELEEVPEFLNVWLQSLQNKVTILCSLEATRRHQKLFASCHRSVQVGDSMLPSTSNEVKSQISTDAPQDETPMSTEIVRPPHLRQKTTDLTLMWAEKSGNRGYLRTAVRTAAAILIQACFRGAAIRKVVGNVHLGFRTPFQARNLNIALLWTTVVANRTISMPSKANLLAMTATLFIGRVAQLTLEKENAKIRAKGGVVEQENSPNTFTEYLMEHFSSLFGQDEVVQRRAAVGSYLLGLQSLHRADPSLTLAFLLVMGDFSSEGERCVFDLIAATVGVRNVHSNPLFLALDLTKTDDSVTQNQIRQALRRVSPSDALATNVLRVSWLHELVIPPWATDTSNVRLLDRKLMAMSRRRGLPEGCTEMVEVNKLTVNQFLLLGALATALPL